MGNRVLNQSGFFWNDISGLCTMSQWGSPLFQGRTGHQGETSYWISCAQHALTTRIAVKDFEEGLEAEKAQESWNTVLRSLI